MDMRPIVLINGLLLAVLAVAMLVPALVDAVVGNPDWQVFLLSAGVTAFTGVAMALTTYSGGFSISVRQGFVMTTSTWLVVTAFGSLPFMLSEMRLDFTDAFFETMSGITTTGATVIVGLDHLPPGILLWRALLQWLGGIGIIVMAIAVMPMLRVGGMQLFRMESSERSEKALPRAAQIASAIALIYLILTVVWTGAYAFAGMSFFDAVAHAMTTIATGGFSTKDQSMALFESALIEAIATAGMFMGGLPFLLYLKTLRGDYRALPRDSQVRWFTGLVAMLVAMVTAWLWLYGGIELPKALRWAAFNVVSVITGTGYATTDYSLWGSFAVPLFFIIMFIGGCAGSTTCGIKIFRFQVLYAAARTQLHHLFQPHRVFIPFFNQRPVPDEVILSVLSFFFVFGMSFGLLALGLGALGLDYLTAMSSAATVISNVGPGLGPVVGPASTFQSLPDAAKWLLSAGMLLGRLEIFTVLVLFTRSFWRA